MAKFFFNFQAQFFVLLIISVVGSLLILPDMKTAPHDVTVDCIRIEHLDTTDKETGYREFKCIREQPTTTK